MTHACIPIVLLALASGACATELGGRRSDASAGASDAALDASSSAPDTSEDAARSSDAATTPDDAWTAQPVDTGPACTPTRTSCHGELECGPGPNGCPGGVLDCGPCSGGETWCAVLPGPAWLTRVHNCVSSVISAHPEYFDFTMACAASSPLVLDARAAEYVRDVAACVNGSGAVAIVDPNAPMNEIRVRADTGDVADNYPVRVYSTGCTRYAYTSSCTPAGF